MKRIPNIKLNEKQVQELLTKHKLAVGGEATICEAETPYTLYKIFSEYGMPKPMGDNKEKKITNLYQKDINYSIRPVSTISLNDMIIGYEMINEYDLDSFKLYQLNRDELLYFLKESKRILEYFSSKEIIYGDVESRNILFNRYTGEIKFCDMDNTQIDIYPMDKLPYSLTEYVKMRGIDNGVHPYMHNRMTLKAFEIYLYYSSKSDIKKVFERHTNSIIKSMIDPRKFNDEYIVTYIKKRQLF